MKPKPFCELKNLTVPVAILASSKRTNASGSHNHLRDPISGFGVFLGKARRAGRCKAGKISNAAHIGLARSICNGDLVTRISGGPNSADVDDLRVGLPGPYDVADLFAEQCARHRRNMRERAARRIGLVFTNDPKGLTASVVTHDGHGRAEMHARRVLGRRSQLSGRSPRVPIAKVARRARG